MPDLNEILKAVISEQRHFVKLFDKVNGKDVLNIAEIISLMGQLYNLLDDMDPAAAAVVEKLYQDANPEYLENWYRLKDAVDSFDFEVAITLTKNLRDIANKS